MVILALGMLGLEALGINAARSNALADRQSGFATIASDSLESALHQLRRGTIPSQFCQTNLSFGDRMSRTVDMSNSRLGKVTVRVIPNSTAPHAPTSNFEITSSLFLSAPIAGAVQGSPC